MIESLPRRRHLARLLPVLLLPALAACGAQGRVASTAPAAAPVTVGIIALNDFHGALEPPRTAVTAPDGKGGTVQVPAGGAAWLASAVDSVRGQYAHSLTVAAGDLTSASQLASSIYLDEPAVGAMNRIGLDFNAVGNHEFDRGRQELLRLQRGGCEQLTARAPCQVEPFKGARYQYLAASTLTETGQTLFPASAIRSFGTGKTQVKIGVIGLTLKDTPDLVSPDGIKGLTFADEADSINALVPGLKAQGAAAIVVMIHQGGGQDPAADPSGCEGFNGAIRPILDRMDSRVDVVVSGHTHRSYVCDYGRYNPDRPFLLTSAGSAGTLVTDIALDIDPATRKVVARRARNVIVQSTPFTGSRGAVANTDAYPRFAPRADVAAYVQTYVDAAQVFSRRTVGQVAGPVSGRAMGYLIADAQLAATRAAGAQIAFTNPFGVRASLIPAPDGSLTFGDLYAVQPFNNTLVTQTMSGAQLKAVLEQGFDSNGPEQVLAPSAGFTFHYDRRRPMGDRIVTMALDGTPIDPAASYRVTTNSFLAGGGDTFTGFAAQRDAVIGISDLEATEAWVKALPARAVPTADRTFDADR